MYVLFYYMAIRNKWEHTYPTYSNFRRSLPEDLVYPGGDAFKYNRCETKFNRPSTAPKYLEDYEDPRMINRSSSLLSLSQQNNRSKGLKNTKKLSHNEKRDGVSFNSIFPRPPRQSCEACQHIQSVKKSRTYIPHHQPQLPFRADEKPIKFAEAHIDEPRPILINQNSKMILSSLRRPPPDAQSVPSWTTYTKWGNNGCQPTVMKDPIMARRFAEVIDTCVRTHNDIHRSFLKIEKEHKRLEDTLNPIYDQLNVMTTLSEIPVSRAELMGYIHHAAEAKSAMEKSSKQELEVFMQQLTPQKVSVRLACPLRNWKVAGGDSSL